MNRWSTTYDNSSMVEGFMSSDLTPLWPSTPSLPPASPQTSCASTTTKTIDPSKSLSQSQPSVPFFNEETLLQRLQTLIDGARESWTYAIFWQASYVDYACPSLLGWGDGYYKGEEDKCKRNTASSAEQEHRKMVFRELNSLISGPQAPTDEAVDEVTDTEWFFLVSMTQSFVNGYGLPGQAFFNSSPVWLAGADRLAVSHCERARQAQVYGLQTLVCIPSSHGVVELGSTELRFQSSDLMEKVRVLFNFNSIEMGSGSGSGSESESWSMPTEHGENDPSASWLTDPSSSAKESVNTASGNSISSLSHLVRQYLRTNKKKRKNLRNNNK